MLCSDRPYTNASSLLFLFSGQDYSAEYSMLDVRLGVRDKVKVLLCRFNALFCRLEALFCRLDAMFAFSAYVLSCAVRQLMWTAIWRSCSWAY